MDVVKFQAYHLQVIEAQEGQARQISHVPGGCANLERAPGSALTVYEGKKIVMCGGMLSFGSRIGLIWAVLAHDAGKHMLWLHRATARFIDMQSARRIEATIEKGFSPGCRWVELLGFEFEGEMRGFGDRGETCLRYALVRQ